MKNKKNTKLIWFVVFILAVFIISAAVLNIYKSAKIAFGVEIAGQNIGGLTYEAAKQKITEIAGQLSNQTIELAYYDKRWSAMPEQLGFIFYAEQTLINAYSLGHNKNFLFNTIEQIELFFRPVQLSIYSLQDPEKLNNFIEKSLFTYERHAKNATLAYDKETDDFYLVPAEEGVIFDRQDIINQIQN